MKARANVEHPRQRALLAAMVEAHPDAAWSDEARHAALVRNAKRNALVCYVLTGAYPNALSC